MAAKTFREDLRRARLEALAAPKSTPKPISKPETKPVEVKPPVATEAKTTKIKKEME